MGEPGFNEAEDVAAELLAPFAKQFAQPANVEDSVRPTLKPTRPWSDT